MKRSFGFSVLIVLLFFLIGCSNNITDDLTTNISITDNMTDENQLESMPEEMSTLNTTESTSEEADRSMLGLAGCGFRTYADEDMKQLGVEKKLVVLCYEYTARFSETIASKLNELLVNKYDCDFVVEIIGFGGTNGYYSQYCDALKDVRELGEQADIIICGISHHVGGEEAPVCDFETYNNLIEEGYLEDITDVLKNTAEGKLLYEAIHERLWKRVERNGNIYGMSPTMACYSQQIMVCDKELADSLGIVIEDGFSVNDISSMLEAVSDKLTEKGLIGCCRTGAHYWYRNLRYECVPGAFARLNEAGEWVACNPFLDEEFIEMYKSVRDLYEKGWILSGMDNINADKAGKYSSGKYVFEFTSSWRAIELAAQANRVYSKNKGITEVYVGDVYKEPIAYETNEVTAIASWSNYKEEAIKLLRIFQTEEEIVNLLTYGIEDEHYIYANREVINLVNSFKGGWGEERAVMLNKLLTYPTYLEPDDKELYYEGILENAVCNWQMQYGYEIVETAKRLENYDKISAIMQEYINGLEYGEYEDVEATIKEANLRLQEAGIDEYINELNKLFESRRGKG